MQNKNHAAIVAVIASATILIPTSSHAAVPMSDLTNATTFINLDNGAYQQNWHWSTLAGGMGLNLNSQGTGAANGQHLLYVGLSGANSASNVSSTAGEFANAHSGTNSRNYGLVGSAGGGTENYGVVGVINTTHGGDIAVWGKSTSGQNYATYAVKGTSESSLGWAGYFENINGGYAGAFMGGNVGIGSSTPIAPLDIGTSGGIRIASGVPASTSLKLYNNAGTLMWNGAVLGTGSSVSGTTNYIPVFTSSTSLGNSIIYQSSSKIGIGSTAPVSTLDIVGGTTIFVPSAVTGTDYNFAGNVSSAFMMRDTSGGTGGQSAVYILRNGSFVGTISTTNVATQYNTSSDRRIKQNIVKSAKGLAELQKIQVMDFDYKADSSKTKHQGLIAQDLNDVYPDAVTPNGDDGKTALAPSKMPWAVDYGRLTPLLIASVQELKGENDDLRKDVEALRAELTTYKAAHP